MIRALTPDEERHIFSDLVHGVFEGVADFRYRDWLDADAIERQTALGARMGDLYRCKLGAFVDGAIAGWSVGVQDSAETYQMVNSAVLPAFRGRGIYRALVDATLAEVAAQGFQRVYSRHVATNNAVIVPKLKAGFVITGTELSDRFGALVHLSWFPHAARRKVLDYRAGLIQPDDEVRAYMRM